MRIDINNQIENSISIKLKIFPFTKKERAKLHILNIHFEAYKDIELNPAL